MTAIFHHLGAMRRAVAAAMVVATLLLAAGPATSLAQEIISPGYDAMVTNTGGEGVLFREGPGYDAAVLLSLPEGSLVGVTDGPIYAEDGSTWYEGVVQGTRGYVNGDYLTGTGQTTVVTIVNETTGASAGSAGNANSSASAGTVTSINADGPSVSETDNGMTRTETTTSRPPTVNGEPTTTQQRIDVQQEIAPAAGTTTWTNDTVNLRAAPTTGSDVLREVPAGSEVAVTGESGDGWTPVWFDGTDGFIKTAYLGDNAGDRAADGNARSRAGARSGVATVIEGTDLLEEPQQGAAALLWVEAGATFVPSAGPDRGFYQGTINGVTGWISGAYLSFDNGRDASGNGDQVSRDASAFNGVFWPVSGGEWYVMQGYNGSSHQNSDAEWQYYYSLDIARNDGDTAGASVTSPVNGTVRWIDENTGGVSIDLGNGHAIAMFHISLDRSIRAGVTLRVGDYVGYISGPYEMGFRESPHLHITHWLTNDGGNWDRQAAPFSGEYAISGMEFPDLGGSYQHSGEVFYP